MFHKSVNFYKELELNTYNCQIGMYFSAIKQLENGFIVYSNIVKSLEWNFFTGFKAETINEFLIAYNKAKLFFNKINRKPCILIAPNTIINKEVTEYINKNYNSLTTSVTLFAKTIKSKQIDSLYTFKKINNETEKDIFINTFKTSKTQTLPNDTYNALPNYYFDALYQSFNNKTDWTFEHFLSMFKNQPIGMISACTKNEYCGLYGGGTYINHRGNGVFTNLLKFIENYYSKKGIKYYFLTTKKDSYNEKLYNSIGFKTIFENKYFFEETK